MLKLTRICASRITVADKPLPSVDIAKLLAPLPPRDSARQTISLETLSVLSDGSTSTIPSPESHILYDTETLAIVHRHKGSDGLVATSLYARRGRNAPVGGDTKEARKVEDLARRFGTKSVDARQGRETEELASLFGGRLITREGIRAHYEISNTQMYIGRRHGAGIFIDQVDLVSLFGWPPSNVHPTDRA